MANESTESQDEILEQQQNDIVRETVGQLMLIGPHENLNVLTAEYINDDVYSKKVMDLSNTYNKLRKVRPDGNCFFRAFGFAYLEHLSTNEDEHSRFTNICDGIRNRLVSMEFPDFTIQDIYGGFKEVADSVSDGSGGSELLYSFFNDQMYSDYVVSYLRLIVSAHIREREPFYRQFMESGTTVADFCRREVEPMNKESDHIHINALSAALGASVRVCYMDRSNKAKVNAHDFPGTKAPVVYLLYRPGHYDILYPQTAQ